MRQFFSFLKKNICSVQFWLIKYFKRSMKIHLYITQISFTLLSNLKFSQFYIVHLGHLFYGKQSLANRDQGFHYFTFLLHCPILKSMNQNFKLRKNEVLMWERHIFIIKRKINSGSSYSLDNIINLLLLKYFFGILDLKWNVNCKKVYKKSGLGLFHGSTGGNKESWSKRATYPKKSQTCEVMLLTS